MDNFCKNNEKKILIFIIFISLGVKVLIYFFYGDNSLSNEWAVLYKNLDNHGVLSFHNLPSLGPVPNSYMPPFYAYFILFLSKITFFDIDLTKKILVAQIFISCFSSVLIFHIFKNFFDRKFSFLATIIYTLYPLNLYASSKISSISISMFLFCLFLFFFIRINKNHFYDALLLGVASGLLILARGEFYLLFLLLIFFKVYEKKIKIINYLTIFLITFIIIFPYLKRNLDIFNKFTITESKGYNLWRGNNQLSTVDGIISHNFIYNSSHPKELLILESEDKNALLLLEKKIDSLHYTNTKSIQNRYDSERDKIFYNEAVSNIINDPIRYFILSLKKLFSITFFNLNSSYKNYYNFFNIVPEILISIFGFLGFLNVYKSKENLIFVIPYVFYIFIFSIFFVLPRYKLLILPMLVFFLVKYINIIYEKK